MTLPARLGMSVSGLKLLEDIAWAGCVRVVMGKWKSVSYIAIMLVGALHGWFVQSNIVALWKL